MTTEFQKNIKLFREKLGMSQGTFGQFVFPGTEKSKIVNIIKRLELGEQEPRLSELLQISKTLNISVSSLIGDGSSNFMGITPDIQKSVNDLVGILQSGYDNIKEAITKNIDTFKIAVSQAEKINQQAEEIKDLKRSAAIAEKNMQKEMSDMKAEIDRLSKEYSSLNESGSRTGLPISEIAKKSAVGGEA